MPGTLGERMPVRQRKLRTGTFALRFDRLTEKRYAAKMQMTIELPERLARQLETEREHLAEIIENGLRQRISHASGLRREIVSFLARGPQPREIVAFKPSPEASERIRSLLHRKKEENLTPAEAAEMEEIAELDQMVSLIKAEARLHLQQPS